MHISPYLVEYSTKYVDNWVEQWHATSTLAPKTRATARNVLSKIGRWLAEEHPEITEPGQWTRQKLRVLDRRARSDEHR